ncbi:MAG TPA: 23S rRNA (guanosine(2251)-2'-O)-methyltransferase RlmB [Spirochaetota bacterium]|nr:23S rRNA (guanosine(2251)-2'-O)-methyltransferase RlmB [Spirochaetota bacterium]HOM37550.1 23S rRNA (guanosine(2251)-2'-O)-methyltransferase RlmB [Spirochaetota bacterium]HPQ49478.1 23S rRNA (guanosine(2251)-2'-O)-methyltransferase RlmB [Spirochaetota bacterium]
MENIVIGFNPVIALLQSNIKIEEVLISINIDKSKNRSLLDILDKKSKNIKVSYLKKEELDKIAGTNNNQGIVAKIKTQINYREINEFKESNTLLILDHIQDPQNLGAIIRSANLFKVDAVVIPEKRACPITSTVIKASSGAIFFTPIVKINSILSTIKNLKEWGFWIYTADMSGEDVRKINFDGKTALIIGSEDGVSQKVIENSDFLVKIPTAGNIDSLNASVASGILLYNVFINKNHF